MLKTLLVFAVFVVFVERNLACCASGGSTPPLVTVLIDFDKPHSARSVDAMEREAAHILQTSGVRVEWQMLKDLSPHFEFPNFVVVHFKGSCDTVDVPNQPSVARSILGLSYASNGEVLPFGEVECDHVKQSIRRVIPASSFRLSEDLLGRALGRVVAHEMYHMLANDKNHTRQGVTRPSLSPDDLVSGELLYSDRAAAALTHR